MKSIATAVVIASTGLSSCEQGRGSMPNTAAVEKVDLTKSVQSQKLDRKHIHTEYVYVNTSGARLIIQNSFPKSGIKYFAPNGKKYMYAVFWTRIINETANPFELKLSFPANSFELPAASGNYMKLFIPADTMASIKEPMFNYGLNVKSFLDTSIRKPSSLRRIIYPKESSSFYVVPLSNRGVSNILRTSLSLRGQKLIYKVNGKEIDCGQVNLKDLALQK